MADGSAVLQALDGESIRDTALRHGLAMPSTCGGVGSCGLCKVRILAGETALAPLTERETSKLGNVFFITRERLGCQSRVHGDVVCELVVDARPARKKPVPVGRPAPRDRRR